MPLTHTMDVDDAIAELTAAKNVYQLYDELAEAGTFIALFGTFDDLFDEPQLTKAQFFTGLVGAAAWRLLGHWSVERGDGRHKAPPGYGDHLPGCEVCEYLEAVVTLIDQFGQCSSCGNAFTVLDESEEIIAVHGIVRGEDGKPQAVCPSIWERVEPRAAKDGDVAEYQISDDAYSARWVTKLTDGYALVTRTYYIGQIEEGQTYIDGVALGVPFVERQDEYMVCEDPADPGGTELNSEIRYTVVESDDPAGEDVVALAEQSFAPEPGEWQENAPDPWKNSLPGYGS